MFKKIFVFFALTVLSFGLSAAPNRSTISVNKGEKWWGVFIGGGEMMPFSKPFPKIDISAWNKGSVTVPFLISNTGRYIYSREPFAIEFTGDSFIIDSQFENVEAVSGGRTLREVYLVACHRNFPPDGKTPALELFVNPVYHTRAELGWAPDATAVSGYADKILSSGYPAGTIVLPAGWQSSIGSYSPNEALYGDFAALVKKLHAKGFKVMLTVTPFVSGDGALFRAHRQDNFFLRNKNNNVSMAEWDAGISACYDITNSAVSSMVRAKLDSLRTHCKVDGFFFDAKDALGLIAEGKVNTLTYLDKWTTLSEGMDFCQYTVSSGSGFAPFIRNINVGSKFDAEYLKACTAGIITSGMLGYPYTTIGADVLPNTEADGITPNFLKRYMQLSAVLPVMNVPLAPWHFSDKANEDGFRAAIATRQKMGAYMGEMVQEFSKTGEPILRHMEYVFPRNGFSDCDDQFMVGTKYLVAPLFGDANTRTVRFPRGVWVDSAGKRFRGPLVTAVTSPDESALVFESAK